MSEKHEIQRIEIKFQEANVVIEVLGRKLNGISRGQLIEVIGANIDDEAKLKHEIKNLGLGKVSIHKEGNTYNISLVSK